MINKEWCRKHRKTKKGIIECIYWNQRRTSRDRGYDLPNYTLHKLVEWVFSQPNFNKIFDNWVESGYEKRLVPSIDRIDPYKSYTFDNIQLMTWEEHLEKDMSDIISGDNRKPLKAVISVNIETGEEIEYYSASEAQRQTGIQQSNIIAACRVKRTKRYISKITGKQIYTTKWTAGGLKWKYKN